METARTQAVAIGNWAIHHWPVDNRLLDVYELTPARKKQAELHRLWWPLTHAHVG
jgi:hypothetical protein